MESIAATSSARHLHSTYDVFLNHRGPEVKRSFCAQLADALREEYYTLFVDEDDARKEEKGSEEIQAALEGASVQLAVISPGCVESKYFLNELVDMLECCKKDPENVKFLPVFFNVKPGYLRWPIDEPFQVAFQVHERRASSLVDEQQRNDEQERIKRWKNALFEAASRDGFEFSYDTRDGNQLKHKVVDRVQSILGNVRKQPVPHPLVGLQTTVMQVEEKLEKMR